MQRSSAADICNALLLMLLFHVVICNVIIWTVVPATVVSASKEAIAPNQIIRPTAEVTALLNEANGEAGYDVGDRSPASIS